MDTLLFSLSHSLCLLQRLRSLTHFSNGCSRVSRRLFRDKEACAVYMDEAKPIYHVDDIAFLLSDFEFHQKNSDRSNESAWWNRITLNILYRMRLFFPSIASGQCFPIGSPSHFWPLSEIIESGYIEDLYPRSNISTAHVIRSVKSDRMLSKVNGYLHEEYMSITHPTLVVRLYVW